MANLFDKIFSPDENGERVPVHVFSAGIRDYVEGETTLAQLKIFFGIDPVEDAQAVTEFEYIIGRIDACSNLAAKDNYMATLKDVLLIADAGAKYTNSSTFNTRVQAIVVR